MACLFVYELEVLCHNALDDVRLHNAGQFLIQAAVEIAKSVMIQSHQMQDRSV